MHSTISFENLFEGENRIFFYQAKLVFVVEIYFVLVVRHVILEEEKLSDNLFEGTDFQKEKI
jgi:hypothetical protein